jgi:hypothetical protein
MATKKKPAAKKKAPANPYVYALADGGEVFYVGKGRNARMYQHLSDAKRGAKGPKADRIRAILARGAEVEHRVLGEYDTDVEACEAEVQFIASMPGLTNQSRGGEGAHIDRRAYAKRHAWRRLSQLDSFEPWVRRLNPTLYGAVVAVFGSPRSFYDRFKAELESEARSPAPNVVFRGPDGKVAFAWE